MQLNKTELKKVLYDFNCASNRLLRSEYKEYPSDLRKYLSYLSGVKLISDYLADCGEPTINLEEDVPRVAKSYGHERFVDFGDTEQEEDANVYGLLKFVVEKNIPVAMGLAFGYSSSNKYNDKLRGFNERVVMILIRHIEAYLTKIGIDMGLDENVKYNITVTNGQVNVANDTATINATVNNGIDGEKLKQLLSEVKKACSSGLSEDDAEMAQDSLEVIQEELSKPRPRKGFIQTAITALSAIKGTAEFAAAVVALVQFVQTFI